MLWDSLAWGEVKGSLILRVQNTPHPAVAVPVPWSAHGGRLLGLPQGTSGLAS